MKVEIMHVVASLNGTIVGTPVHVASGEGLLLLSLSRVVEALQELRDQMGDTPYDAIVADGHFRVLGYSLADPQQLQDLAGVVMDEFN